MSIELENFLIMDQSKQMISTDLDVLESKHDILRSSNSYTHNVFRVNMINYDVNINSHVGIYRLINMSLANYRPLTCYRIVNMLDFIEYNRSTRTSHTIQNLSCHYHVDTNTINLNIIFIIFVSYYISYCVKNPCLYIT